MSRTNFTPGQTYFARSACDSFARFEFQVVRRTAKTVWLAAVDRGNVLIHEQTRHRIHDFNTGAHTVETCLPLGNYSMAPCLKANALVD